MCQQDAGLWSLGSWGVSEIPPGALKNLSLSPQLPSLPSGEGHRVHSSLVSGSISQKPINLKPGHMGKDVAAMKGPWQATWKGFRKQRGDGSSGRAEQKPGEMLLVSFISLTKCIPRQINHQPHTRWHDSLHLGPLSVQPGSIRHKFP